jgi:hypothetical protein
MTRPDIPTPDTGIPDVADILELLERERLRAIQLREFEHAIAATMSKADLSGLIEPAGRVRRVLDRIHQRLRNGR